MHTSGPMLVAAMVAMVTAGCAVSPRAAEDGAPPDFSVDLTILVGSSAAQDSIGQPHHLRQSRYVVFPNGRLHFGADPRRGPQWLPPAVRTLDSHAMRQLWSLAGETSLGDAQAGEEPFNFRLVEPEPGQVMYLLAMTGQSRRWVVTRVSSIQAPDPAMAQFINHLAELAWVETTAEALRPLPARYDFGPDPYERYR